MATGDYAETGFLLGYGGWAAFRLRSGSGAGAVKGGKATAMVYVPCESASYSRRHSVPLLNAFSLPWNRADRAPVRIGFGTFGYTGSLDFELDDQAAAVLFSDDFFVRRNFLDIELCDGEALLRVPGAVWNSLTITAAAGQLVKATIAFDSCNGYNRVIEAADAEHPHPAFGELQPYWSYGADGIENFTLTIGRETSPVYLNEPYWCGPTYIRVGRMSATLAITCWRRWFNHRSIRLGDRTIKFNANSFQESREYRLSGQEESAKSYTLQAAAGSGDGALFTFD